MYYWLSETQLGWRLPERTSILPNSQGEEWGTLLSRPWYRILQGNTFSSQLVLTFGEPSSFNLSNTNSDLPRFTIWNFTFGKSGGGLRRDISICLSSLFFIHLVFLLLLSRMRLIRRSLRQWCQVLWGSDLSLLGCWGTGGMKYCCWGSCEFHGVLTFKTLIQLLILFISYHSDWSLGGPAATSRPGCHSSSWRFLSPPVRAVVAIRLRQMILASCRIRCFGGSS